MESMRCAARALFADERGQGTVEAALVIPIMLALLLLLIQPGIVLYDRMVMKSAAAEGCRLLATRTDEFGSSSDSCEAFVRHRLAAVPAQDCFHVHGPSCTWNISLSGDESSEEVAVSIENQVKPLPLFDGAATLAGFTNEDGNLVIRVRAALPSQPGWVASSPAGRNPSSWIGAWSQ